MFCSPPSKVGSTQPKIEQIKKLIIILHYNDIFPKFWSVQSLARSDGFVGCFWAAGRQLPVVLNSTKHVDSCSYKSAT